jgi:hypothetical protein
MKKPVYYSMVLILIFLSACGPAVVFDTPQPTNVDALSSFPEKLQGKYLSSEDSSVLQITENSLIRIYDFDQKVHISQLDTNQQIIGDTLYNFKSNTAAVIQIEGDSVIQHVNGMDTLFTIDQMNVLKKFKGYYFVNICKTTDTWEVNKLSLSRDALTLSSISKKDDIDQLKELTDKMQDSIPYVFSPSRKQFKNFIRNGGFRDSETFSRIRE